LKLPINASLLPGEPRSNPSKRPIVRKRTDEGSFKIYAASFNLKDSQMNKDQIKGAVKDAAGKVQKEAGSLVGSVNQQVKGAVLQAEGKAQKHLGDAEQVTKDTRHALNKATSKQI
jgi:uncharacterized protein YjbJ (UPF0337 family)